MKNNFLITFYIYFKNNLISIILITLSIYDLRTDLRLLFDFFTLSSLIYTITEHPLAIVVLITSSKLLIFKKYNKLI